MSEDGPEDLAMALWPEVNAIPGAAECLHELDGRLPLAIATNATISTRPMIERALARVTLSRYFTEFFCFAELGFRKSELEFWEIVSVRLGIPPKHIAMIGDSYEQDALAPRRHGIQGVWFNAAGAPPGANRDVPEVDRLTTFASWVRCAA